jgi:hypothetical protein
VSNLNWSYWSLNGEDAYSVLASNYVGLRNTKKEYSFLCFIQQGLLAVPMGTSSSQCGSTGMLPAPDSSAPVSVPPPAPTGVTAIAGDAQVQLSWLAAAGASSYSVKYAAVSGGPYETVAAALTSTTFLQPALTNGTTYYYVVTATGSAGESASSAQVSATPVAPQPPSAPTGVTATAGNAQVQLSWSAATGATSYTVKYATVSGGPYQTVASAIATTSFTQSALTNGTMYYFVVSATGSAGESPNSGQVSAMPVVPPPPPTSSSMSIWWPTNDAVVSGTTPFKAQISSLALSDYKMYWQVDGDRLNSMGDSYVDAPHKEALVDVSTWYWHGNGPYLITFVAKSKANKVIAQSSVNIYISR